MGKIPYEGFSADGDQFLPRTKSNKPNFEIAGMPLANKKKHIKSTEIIEMQAVSKKTTDINFTKSFLFIYYITSFKINV